ncbi:MOLPALP family lipoprotein [Spiroplasma endosymbiont of Panorpa germanica]|uniref:MOLPALP family lipoprotein n=1 Tax=Spiroplasma endosymbiont of Panorpa germanica TaxID=3066314 RepID=UPI0030CF8F6B
MKKLLSILGVTSIASSSVIVTSCSVLTGEINKNTSKFTLAQVTKFVSQSYVLSDAENININDSLDYYANQKINTLMPNLNANNNSLMKTLFKNTFNSNNPNPEFFSNLNANGLNLSGSRSFTDDTFNQISSILNVLVLAIKNGFGIKEATVIEGLLKSEAIRGVLTPELIETISKFLNAETLSKLEWAFDFDDLVGKTNQQAIDYSVNSLTIGLAQLLGQDTLIEPDSNEKLTLFTPFPETGSKNTGDATYVMEKIIGGIISGETKIEVDMNNIVPAISYIIKSLIIMVKYIAAFEEYDNTVNVGAQSHLNLFGNEISDLTIVNDVRGKNFDTNSTINFRYLLDILHDVFDDNSTNLNGFGFQKLLTMLFKVDNLDRHEYSLIGNSIVNKGYSQLIVGIGKGLKYIEGIPSIIKGAIHNLIYKIVIATTNGAEFGFNQITLNLIKAAAPDIHETLTNPEIVKKMNNIFNELYSGTIIKDLLSLFADSMDSNVLDGIKNLNQIFKTPLKKLLSLFGLELPLVLESLINISLRDAVIAFRKNYEGLDKVEINLNDIKKIFTVLGQEDYAYNALGEVQFNNQKQSGITLILNLLVNPGWYVQKDGKKMDISLFLGFDKQNQTLIDNSLFGSLHNILDDKSGNGDYSGLFFRKTLTGIIEILNFVSYEMMDVYKKVFTPYLDSGNFKQFNLISLNSETDQEIIEYDIEYTSPVTKKVHLYHFAFKTHEIKDEKYNISKFWEMIGMKNKH